jgi:gamma-glutamylcyclotransferase (GGCT)/AIG2-like uncharacterized protein YtfP
MPLYFAYGANLDVEAMAMRCPGAKPIGLARLPRHRWIISADGYANVIRDARRDVHGMLWDLALSDVPPLDKYEDVPRLYRKVQQPVISTTGIRRAMVYLGRSTEVGRPRAGYLEMVLAAAEKSGLPKPYRAEMAAFGDQRATASKPATTSKPAAAKGWQWTP